MRGAAVSTVLAAALLCAACEPRAKAIGRSSDALVNATFSDPRTFNPVMVTDATSSEALEPIFEGLTRINLETTLVEPWLAERWEWNDAGTECTFHLRRDVRWHDGTPFTAADVAFTFSAIFDEKVPNSAKYILTVDGKPITWTVIDPHTVRFHLPRRFAPFLSAVGVSILPAHLFAEALADGSFTRRWGIDTPPAELVGTGPYRLARYVPAQLLEYRANPDYWRYDGDRRLPYIPRRVTMIVPDQNAQILRFLAGHTHLYDRVRPEEIPELEDRAQELDIIVAQLGIDPGSQFVAFNLNPKRGPNKEPAGASADARLSWFRDHRFRLALAHAVDKQGMIATVLHGYGDPAVSYISPANKLFYASDLTDYPYDLARAAAMLEEAGYVDRDGDGWREDQSGNRIEFGLTTNAGNSLRERICSILREDWTELGLKINYRPQTFQALVERLNVTYEWDSVLIGFTGTIDPNDGANVLRSSGNLHLWHPRQEKPATEWEAEIDRLLEAGAGTLEIDERRAAYWRIQEILHHELPVLETVRSIRTIAYSRRLQNFVPTVWGIAEPSRIDFAP